MPNQMNESQLKAVQFADGALLLLAGPGSGKTTVITHRIKFLISDHGISPEKILVITFTKAAAIEMKERFLRLMEQSDSAVVFGTFHAVFYQILRSSKKYKSLSLIQEKERIKLIKNILKHINQDNSYAEADLPGVIKQISKYKNDPDAQYDFLSDTLDEKQFPIFMQEYKQYMTDLGKLDFDDMVLLCYKTLLNEPELLTYWSNRFTYFLIDEFQDINKMQYEVMKLLCKKSQNLFVVGDDDQSIYGFRGAKPLYMKLFLKDFKDAKQYTLDMNYRCAKKIVDCSNRVIAQNKDRFDKTMKANAKEEGIVKLHGLESQKQEFHWIAEEIKQLAGRGISYRQIAILCRTNRDLLAISTFLECEKIPSSGEGNMKTMFDQIYIQTLLMYLTFISGDHSRDVFYKFMNKPLRFIKREAVQKEYVTEKELLMYYRDHIGMRDTIHTLFGQIERMERMKPALAVHYIRKVIGFDAYVKENADAAQYEEYRQLAELFQEFTKEYKEFESLFEAIDGIQNRSKEKGNRNGVQLYTYHGSKGLEFDYVFIPGLIQGQVPPKQARTADAIEEERRMFYVALTRAKNYLAVTWYENESASKSIFLNGLKSE